MEYSCREDLGLKEGEKLVYVPMAADIIHPGHINILRKARELGVVMVGLFTDDAIRSYKPEPYMDYEKREIVLSEIVGVRFIVPQISKDYTPNLKKFHPDYFVHGTDWREGPLAQVRQQAIELIAQWGGKVVEPEYTQGVSSTEFKRKVKETQ